MIILRASSIALSRVLCSSLHPVIGLLLSSASSRAFAGVLLTHFISSSISPPTDFIVALYVQSSWLYAHSMGLRLFAMSFRVIVLSDLLYPSNDSIHAIPLFLDKPCISDCATLRRSEVATLRAGDAVAKYIHSLRWILCEHFLPPLPFQESKI